MTLKTSFIVGLAVAALVVGVEIASAAPTSDGPQPTNFVQPDFGQKFLYPGGYTQSASDRTNLVQPDFGQSFLYPAVDYSQGFVHPGGYPQSGHGHLGSPDSGQSFVYPGGYALSGLGYIGNPPVSASTVDSGSGIEWPQQLGIALGVGMAVLLGLILTVRIGRSHPLAH